MNEEHSMESAAAKGMPSWIPWRFWRAGLREVNLLALDLVLAGHAGEATEPLCRSLLAGRALGLSLRVPDEWFSKPAAAATGPWKAYRLKDWVFDMSERFGELDVPEGHPCSELYDWVRDSLDSLKSPASVGAAMDELVARISSNAAGISALHAMRPPLRISAEGMLDAAFRLKELERLLAAITGAVGSMAEPLQARSTRLVRQLRLACECSAAILENRAEAVLPLLIRLPAFDQLDDTACRSLLRALIAQAPPAKIADLLKLLAQLEPTAEDRPLFAAAFRSVVPPAVALLLRVWPDAESRELLRNTLEAGLAAAAEDLVTEGASPTKATLTPLGQQVSSAILFAKEHLAATDAVTSLAEFLKRPGIETLKRSAVEQLAEIGGPEAAAAMVPIARTATGQLLSQVAEAIEKLPSSEALDALFARLPDRTLRLDRLPMIDALAKHRPDEALRAALMALLREPGCRCGGCVWKRALWKLASLWPDANTRELVEATLVNEPGYEGRASAARVLAHHWPDARTIHLLQNESIRRVSGSGEGEFGHLPADGLAALDDFEKAERAQRYSAMLSQALDTEIEHLRNPAAAEESSQRITQMIARLMMKAR